MTLAFPSFDAAVAAGRSPRPYQLQMIDVQRREPTWFCTAEMGLGKSFCALMSAPLGWGVLVVCPASTRGLEREAGRPVGGWLAEAQRVRPDLKRTRLEGDGGAILTPAQVAELEAVVGKMAPTCEEDRKVRARAQSRLRANAKREANKFRYPEPGELAVASYETERTSPNLGLPAHPILLIFDEAQAIKGEKAAQTKVAVWLVAAVLAAGGKALAMTGTPLMKDPEDLKTILSVMKLFQRAFGDDGTFGRCFNRGLRTQVFGRPKCTACGKPVAEQFADSFGMSDCCGAKLKKPRRVTSYCYGAATPEAVARFKRVSLGFLREDVTDLPPVVTVEHAAELDQEGIRVLNELGKLTDEELLSTIERERVASDPSSHFAKARAALSAAKRAVLPLVVDEIVDAGEKVVLFADHRTPIIETVESKPGWGGVIGSRSWVHGEPDTKREAVIDRFARGELLGIGLTLGAGGVGVDGLQRSARHLVLLEESLSPSLIKQAVGRLRRIGQAGTVIVHKLTTGHVVEQRVQEIVERKMQYLDMVDEARKHDPQVVLGGWDLGESVAGNEGGWDL